MSRKNLQRTVLTENLDSHMATLAWSAARGRECIPHQIDVFKGRDMKTSGKKSFIYRLHGAGEDGGMLIAKKARAESVAVEHLMYTEILPSVGLPHLRFHGMLPSPSDGMCWIFLQDAGEQVFSREVAEHREAAAHWLARLHLMTHQQQHHWILPRRDVAHYSEMSREAQQVIRSVRDAEGFGAEHRAIMDDADRLLEELDGRWAALEADCSALPDTLVHADLVDKNIRLGRDSAGALTILVFDWEMAGWGSPAGDLATSRVGRYDESLMTYWNGIRETWPRVSPDDIRSAARAGMLLRTAAAMQWGCYSLNPKHLDRPFRRLAYYTQALTELLQAN